MKLTALTLAGFVALAGSASAQTIQPNGQYVPALQSGTVPPVAAPPATNGTMPPRMTNGMTYAPGTMMAGQATAPCGSVVYPATTATSAAAAGMIMQSMPAYAITPDYTGMTAYQPSLYGPIYNDSQYFPSSMPGSTVLNGTTGFIGNTTNAVVGGTRRAARRGLGLFRGNYTSRGQE